MRNIRWFRNLLTAGFIGLFSSTVSSHEFWIEAHDFSISPQDKLVADIKVGQELSGNKHIYLPEKFIAFTLTQNATSRPVASRAGDMPPINEAVPEDGLVILAYESNARELTYTQAKKFQSFLEYEGIAWVKEKHIERKLPAKGFKELYYRYGKALVKVGEGQGEDKALGLPFELVIEKNPYLNPDDPIEAVLLWQGKPFPDARVSVFFKDKESVVRSLFTTNDLGKVAIPRPEESGIMLLNAVHMGEPDIVTSAKTRAVWESYWASTTFGVE